MRNFLKSIWQDESAQGATEYILIVAAIVVVLFTFRSKLTEWVNKMMDNTGGQLDSFTQGN